MRGTPQRTRVDNSCEFTSKVLDQGACWNKVTLDFTRSGKTTDNAYIEAFNGRFRRECLNENWFYRWPAHRRRWRPGGRLQSDSASWIAGQFDPGGLRAASLFLGFRYTSASEQACQIKGVFLSFQVDLKRRAPQGYPIQGTFWS